MCNAANTQMRSACHTDYRQVTHSDKCRLSNQGGKQGCEEIWEMLSVFIVFTI